MNDTYILFFATVAFGTVIGAFYGTVEYRVRSNEGHLLAPDCYCPVCRHTLPLIHQIPVISWIMLKGRCKFCGCRISPIYPVVESGFALYYAIVFVLFHSHPVFMTCVWTASVAGVLLARCNGHYRLAIQGVKIFTLVNIFYGALVTIITAAIA